MNTFERELTALINRYSIENESDTPDFILAELVRGCLVVWKDAIRKRDEWFGYDPWWKNVEGCSNEQGGFCKSK